MNQSKIALVTGGSRGMGKDMALSLAQRGIDVILTYHRKKEEADEVVNAIEALGQRAAALQLDVMETSGFKYFAKEVAHRLKTVFKAERINYLVNNAGILAEGRSGITKP